MHVGHVCVDHKVHLSLVKLPIFIGIDGLEDFLTQSGNLSSVRGAEEVVEVNRVHILFNYNLMPIITKRAKQQIQICLIKSKTHMILLLIQIVALVTFIGLDNMDSNQTFWLDSNGEAPVKLEIGAYQTVEFLRDYFKMHEWQDRADISVTEILPFLNKTFFPLYDY